MYDDNDAFFKKLVSDHVSGQLKVAPEHISDRVLDCMGKPHIDVYNAFKKKYFDYCKEIGKEQYLVPYLMSSHPGSTVDEAIELACYLKAEHYAPEQVQDYYPTPGTASTVMYYTGINPLTGKKVYVPTTYEEKSEQRALLQFNKPDNAAKVRSALIKAGRDDLIGFGGECLVKPERAPHFEKKKDNKENVMQKSSTIKIITIASIVLLVLLFIALVINVIKLSSLNNRKAELQTKLAEIERQIDENTDTIDYLGTDDYIDRYAREYLNMNGEGEEAFTGK